MPEDTTARDYWVFSNKSPGTYGGSVWDMQTILDSNRYYIKESERNRTYVESGDLVVMRIYGDSYLGEFTVAGEWQPDPDWDEHSDVEAGWFPMKDVCVYERAAPQSLVMSDLSNGDVRSRLVSITRDDVVMVRTTSRLFARLGLGPGDDRIVVLEEGIEEAIKPNLERMGLQPAEEEIEQQFSMGPGVGRSDLIYLDEDDNLVVVELKRGVSSDAVVGQILRYMGYVEENIARPEQKVHGWIVTGGYDESLRLAAAAAGLRLYRNGIDLTPGPRRSAR